MQESSVIPLHIWQTYPTKILPPRIAYCVEELKKKHPTFDHHLFDDEDCRQFIRNYYPKEVLVAYDALIPGAYKADLWRLCVLYIHGGIYMDIKLEFVGDASLYRFLDKEYFVNDGEKSIYNAFMVLKKHNPMMKACIIRIVNNVATQTMGDTPWDPTGPRLVGSHYDWTIPLELLHFGPTSNETIRNTSGTIILKHCNGYREEQSNFYGESKKKYYQESWNDKKIYKACNIDMECFLQEMI